jgi:hypothetical protein
MLCESWSRHRQDAGRRGASRRSRDAEGDADRRACVQNGLLRSSRNCSDTALVAAPRACRKINFCWRSKTSSSARRERPRRTKPSRPPRARRERANGAPTAAPCRPSCRASRRSSTSRTRPARAARARCTGSARTSASDSRHPSRSRIFWLQGRPSSRRLRRLSRACRQR